MIKMSVDYYMKITVGDEVTEISIHRVGFRKYKGSLTRTHADGRTEGGVTTGHSVKDVRLKLGVPHGMIHEVRQARSEQSTGD